MSAAVFFTNARNHLGDNCKQNTNAFEKICDSFKKLPIFLCLTEMDQFEMDFLQFKRLLHIYL